MSSMTPYAASKIVNAALAEAGVDKVLPAQMFYNYTSARTRKGKAALIAVDENGKITEAGLAAWLEKYLAKQVVSA
jgi:hypothetical protein